MALYRDYKENWVSDGSQAIPKRENVRISAASHAEGRHARQRWCGSTASRDRACEGLVYKSTLEKEDRQGERWNEIRRVLVHTLKASRHRRRLRWLMSEVSRVRKADCLASHVLCTVEVSDATTRRRTMMLNVGLRGLHVVTLIRAPCGGCTIAR